MAVMNAGTVSIDSEGTDSVEHISVSGSVFERVAEIPVKGCRDTDQLIKNVASGRKWTVFPSRQGDPRPVNVFLSSGSGTLQKRIVNSISCDWWVRG